MMNTLFRWWIHNFDDKCTISMMNAFYTCNAFYFDDECIIHLMKWMHYILEADSASLDSSRRLRSYCFRFCLSGICIISLSMRSRVLVLPSPTHFIRTLCARYNVRGQNKDVCYMYYYLSFVIFRLDSLLQPIADGVALNLEIIFETFWTDQNSAHGIYD